jgi:hypothetical protein
VDALVAYSGAVAIKDQQGKNQALAQLRAFEKHLSTFLSTDRGSAGLPGVPPGCSVEMA